jgi:hypothetical protein
MGNRGSNSPTSSSPPTEFVSHTTTPDCRCRGCVSGGTHVVYVPDVGEMPYNEWLTLITKNPHEHITHTGHTTHLTSLVPTTHITHSAKTTVTKTATTQVVPVIHIDPPGDTNTK